MRALVLDDDAALGRLVRKTTGALGFVTELTTDGPGFRSQYEAYNPDVVLIDLQVGGTDGVEVLRFLASL
jgi:DNA-binding response OmpR family regulator